MMIKKISTLLFFLCYLTLSAQEEWQPANTIVCGLSEENANKETFNQDFRRNSRVEATSSFEITYSGDISASAKTAVEFAKSIWEAKLISTQPIRVKVVWQSLTSGTLAQTSANRVYRNFLNAPQQNVWYPVALAEALAGKDLNAGDFEITITINSNINWYFGTDAKAQTGRYDLITVVLHEIAHGIGFTSSFELATNTTQAQYGQSNSAYVYDTFIQNSNKQKLTNSIIFGNPSADLKTAITSNAIYFGLKNPSMQAALPRLYAPTTYRDGSSISHFDESTYPSGSTNSLMSPNVRAAEANHNLGVLLLHCLNEMGWQIVDFNGYVITSNEENLSKILVYPNPVEDFLNISIPYQVQSRDISIEIIGLNGMTLKQIKKTQIQEENIQLDMQDLSEGIYFLRIQDNTTNFLKKIVK